MGLDQDSRKRWKATKADYDFVRAASEDKCLFCLSAQQVTLLLASLEMAHWKTRWFSPSNTTIDEDWIDAFLSDLETELMTDHCDLQAAITQIQEDITTINETNIDINASLTVINNNVTTINDTLITVDNSITNINTEIKIIQDNQYITNIYNNITNINLAVNYQSYTVNTVDNTDEEAIARYNSFCYAMVDWVCSACARYGLIFDYSVADYIDVISSVEVALTSFNPLVGLAGMPANSELVDIIGDTRAEAAVANSTAINEIACAMTDYLQYREPTQASFVAALDAWVAANPTSGPPSGWTDSQIIGAMCYAALVVNGAFQAWASTAEYWFQAILATHPTEYLCLPCGTPLAFCSIPQTWDFTQLQLPPWVINRGILVAGQGIVGTQVPGDLNYGIDISIYFPTPCTTIIGKHIEISHAKLPTGGNAFGFEYYKLVSGVPTVYNRASRAQTLGWPAPDVDSTVIPDPTGGLGVYRIRFVNLTPYEAIPTLSTSSSQAAVIPLIRFIT